MCVNAVGSAVRVTRKRHVCAGTNLSCRAPSGVAMHEFALQTLLHGLSSSSMNSVTDDSLERSTCRLLTVSIADANVHIIWWCKSCCIRHSSTLIRLRISSVVLQSMDTQSQTSALPHYLIGSLGHMHASLARCSKFVGRACSSGATWDTWNCAMLPHLYI